MAKDPKVGTGKKPKGSSRRLYTDENPKDTVRIKFATPADARATVKKVKNISGKVLKATGKVIRPVGYLIGANAVLQAKAQAEEQGIDLKLVDYYAALEMGDANAAFDMWKMRNVPEFAAEQRAKTMAIPLDEGTYEVMEEKEVEPTGVEKYIQVTNQ